MILQLFSVFDNQFTHSIINSRQRHELRLVLILFNAKYFAQLRCIGFPDLLICCEALAQEVLHIFGCHSHHFFGFVRMVGTKLPGHCGGTAAFGRRVPLELELALNGATFHEFSQPETEIELFELLRGWPNSDECTRFVLSLSDPSRPDVGLLAVLDQVLLLPFGRIYRLRTPGPGPLLLPHARRVFGAPRQLPL